MENIAKEGGGGNGVEEWCVGVAETIAVGRGWFLFSIPIFNIATF
jgi:hypothetical protein